MNAIREVTGDHYRLTIVEKVATAPPFVGQMFRALLDEMDAKGDFVFHPKGQLPTALQTAEPRMMTKLDGDEITVSLRSGAGEGNSITGSLYVPRGLKPAEVHKQMMRRLEYLNGDRWSDLGLNGSAKASPSPSGPSATTVPPPQVPKASVDNDDVLARELLEKATANRTMTGARIREHLHKHHPQPGNRGFVGEAIARLESKGVLRRVRIENAGEWQFTEAYLAAHGRALGGYRPLPEVTARKPGLHRPLAEAAEAQAPPPSSAQREDPPPDEVEAALPSLDELKQLYADFGCLLEERPQALARVQEAQRALVEIDEKMSAKKTRIDAIKATISKDDLLRFVLQRPSL